MTRKIEILDGENVADIPVPPSQQHPTSGEPIWDQAAVRAVVERLGGKPAVEWMTVLGRLLGSYAEAVSFDEPPAVEIAANAIHAHASLRILPAANTPDLRPHLEWALRRISTSLDKGEHWEAANEALERARSAVDGASGSGAVPIGYISRQAFENFKSCGQDTLETFYSPGALRGEFEDAIPMPVYAAPPAHADAGAARTAALQDANRTLDKLFRQALDARIPGEGLDDNDEKFNIGQCAQAVGIGHAQAAIRAMIDKAVSPSASVKAVAAPVGEIVASDPVHGWHMRPLVPWEQIGAGAQVYASPPAPIEAGAVDWVDAFNRGEPLTLHYHNQQYAVKKLRKLRPGAISVATETAGFLPVALDENSGRYTGNTNIWLERAAPSDAPAQQSEQRRQRVEVDMERGGRLTSHRFSLDTPAPQDKATLTSLRGIAKGAYEGKTAEEHINDVRNGDQPAPAAHRDIGNPISEPNHQDAHGVERSVEWLRRRIGWPMVSVPDYVARELVATFDRARKPGSEADEAAALRDMLDGARHDLDALRVALDVEYEPHQTLMERMLERATLSSQPGAADVLLNELVDQLAHDEADNGDAPGHHHERPGIWNDDNGELSGKPCAWCALWRTARAACTQHPEKGGV
jgi:hypothetical protein